MRDLIEALCSDACAGRRSGTPGGVLARQYVTEALRSAGCDPFEQPAPGCRGANVVVSLPGSIDRWVLVGAHYDHLGVMRGEVYRGADDNAAAVGILCSLARTLTAKRPDGRGVLLVAFDGEEPPFYATGDMGSQHFVRECPVHVDRIDMMVALELLGQPVGPAGLPGEIRDSVFALGAERSMGSSARLDAMASLVPGLHVRRADAEVIPPLSDHLAFWEREVPFLLLAGLRTRVYHTPQDTPAVLDYQRLDRLAAWLDGYVRDQCIRPEERVAFLRGGRDDRSTLDTLGAILDPIAPFLPVAASARRQVSALAQRCGRDGALPESDRPAVSALVQRVESALGGA